jgi:hypothetical protein
MIRIFATEVVAENIRTEDVQTHPAAAVFDISWVEPVDIFIGISICQLGIDLACCNRNGLNMASLIGDSKKWKFDDL